MTDSIVVFYLDSGDTYRVRAKKLIKIQPDAGIYVDDILVATFAENRMFVHDVEKYSYKASVETYEEEA